MCPALLRFLAWPRRDEGAYPQWSVTEEQRRPGQKAKQPGGPRRRRTGQVEAGKWASPRRRKGIVEVGGWANRERFRPSGGVARSLQTAEEAEGNSGRRWVGDQVDMLAARALPSSPK